MRVHYQAGSKVDKFGKIEINTVTLQLPLVDTEATVAEERLLAFIIALLVTLWAMLPHESVEELSRGVVGQE